MLDLDELVCLTVSLRGIGWDGRGMERKEGLWVSGRGKGKGFERVNMEGEGRDGRMEGVVKEGKWEGFGSYGERGEGFVMGCGGL